MFSHYLTYLLEKLRFIKVVIARFLIILFRRIKGIELLRLEYDREHLFDKSFIIIHYRFRNAIYYRFENHKTLEKEIKIFNLKNFANEFTLTAYGFFRKKTYKLKFEPKLTLETSNFKTNFSNLVNDFEFKTIPNLSTQPFNIELNEIEIKARKLKITPHKLVLKHETFNQNDFI
jgi:hypothetical protein